MDNSLNFQEMPEVQKNRWKIFFSVALFTFMATLDGSIINIALPTIAKDFGVNTNQIIWVVAFYMMTICVLLIFFGKLGDIFGKIKIFRIGVILFLFGSILSGFSTSLDQLITFRIFQAIGSAMTMSTNLGIIAEVFTVQDRAKALGFVGSMVSLGTITGPSIGGVIVEHLSWSYIFWLNVPFGLFTIYLGSRYLPKDINTTKTPVDFIGFALYACFIISFFGAMFLAQEIGFDKPKIHLLFASSIIFLVVFIRVELRRKFPLLELKIFKNKPVTYGLICAFLIFLSNFLFYIIMPFYLQDARGFNASHAGFLVMIFPIVMVVASPIAGSFVNKIGATKMASIGLFVVMFAHGLLIFIDIETPIILFCFIVAILGLGNSLFQPSNNSIIMGSVDKKQLGIVGSINALARNIGNITGVAFSTTILFAAMSYKYGSHLSTYLEDKADIFIFGMHVTFTFSFLALLCAFLLSLNRPKH
ncbi:MAG: MFS transporter [Campylobacteraceae bacterium]